MMRQWWLVTFLLVGVLIAGCAEKSPQPQDALNEPTTEPSLRPGDGLNEPQSKPAPATRSSSLPGLQIDYLGADQFVEDWSNVSFHIDGEKGSWMTFSQSIPPATQGKFHLDLQIKMDATSDQGITWMMVPLELVFKESPDPDLHFNDFRRVVAAEHTIDITGNTSWGAGGEINSYFFMFGSDSNWSMDFHLSRNGMGNASAPEFLKGGTGAVFAWSDDRNNIIGESVFELALNRSLDQTGWTELRVVRKVGPGAWVDSLESTFTNGREFRGTYGPELESDMRVESNSVGLMHMPPGTFNAHLRHSSNAEAVDLGLFHIPVGDADFPEGYTWDDGYTCAHSRTESGGSKACHPYGETTGEVERTWSSTDLDNDRRTFEWRLEGTGTANMSFHPTAPFGRGG